MLLKSLHLENVGRFTNQRFDFDTGLIGIYGPNASGKSTITNAIYACLTGDFNRHPEGKAGFVRRGKSKKEISRATLIFESGGQLYELQRSFETANVNLTIDGELAATGAEPVAEKLREARGLDNYALKTFVFISQADLLQFVWRKPGERAEQWSHLCNTLGFADLRESFALQLRRDEARLDTTVDRVDELAAAYKVAKQAVTTAKEAYQEARAAAPNRESYSSWGHDLHQHNKAKAAQLLWRTSKKEEPAALQALEVAEANYKAQREAEGKAQAAYAAAVLAFGKKGEQKLAELAGIANKRVIHGQLVKQYKDAKRSLKEAKASLSAWEQEWPDDAYEKEAIAQNSLGEKSLQTEIDLRSVRHLILVAKGQKEPICETCGSVLTPGDLSDLQERQRKLQDLKAELDKRIRRFREATQKRSDIRKDLLRCRNSCKDAKREIKELGYDPLLNKRYGRLLLKQQARDVAKNKLDSLTKATAEKKETRAEKAKKLSDLQQETRSLRKKFRRLQKYLLSAEERRQRVSQLQDAQPLLQHLAKCRQDLITAKENRIKTKTDLKQARKQRQATAALKDVWLPRLREAVSVLHSSGIPRQVQRQALLTIEPTLNNWLANFESSFAVQVAESELNFDFTEPGDSHKLPVQALSGGQSVLFSVGLFAAVKEHFATSIRCSVLDEPTAWVDADNIGYLATAFGTLSRLLRRNGDQLIIITHEPQLYRVFDQVITL